MIKRGNVGDDSDGSLANFSPLSVAESVSLSWLVFKIRFLLSPRYLLRADDLDRPERLPRGSHVPPGTCMSRISTCPLSYHYGLMCLLPSCGPAGRWSGSSTGYATWMDYDLDSCSILCKNVWTCVKRFVLPSCVEWNEPCGAADSKLLSLCFYAIIYIYTHINYNGDV